eukprot:CAMPEP_0170500488 /NCGR_PEP_ID=MMETSP0208-20121228/35021_1 /TAXON_ID=197538 /ORGANISM="Strombidium inclinatum, Strain S3" /LENGTH=41 /DNA_ID= /DNA_START= /DNA_END= /DNA_ORIENTATION=
MQVLHLIEKNKKELMAGQNVYEKYTALREEMLDLINTIYRG